MASWARRLLRISRPRFWLYLGGTYLVGFTAAAPTLASFGVPVFWLYLGYFLVPANVFLYGLNDLCDEDTDRRNPKKGRREHSLRRNERHVVAGAVAVSAALGVILAAGSASTIVGHGSVGTMLLVGGDRGGGASGTDADFMPAVLMLTFLALGAAYSAPPFRLKARPALDSASNVLYVVPGVIGYWQAAGAAPPVVGVAGAAAWTAAMHLFSAVPDIESDQAAGLGTTATALGPRASLAVCTVLWALAAAALAMLWPVPLALVAFLYPAIPLALLARPALAGRVYWAFPSLNAAAGFCLFLLVAPV